MDHPETKKAQDFKNQNQFTKTKMQPYNSFADSFNAQQKKNNLKIKQKRFRDEQYIMRQAKFQPIPWAKEQDQIYIDFMIQNGELFESQNQRRAEKVFLRLSKLMKGMRTPNQCKSHYQKMQKATKSTKVNYLIQYLQNKHLNGESKQKNHANSHRNTQLDFQEKLDSSFYIRSSVSNIGVRVNVKINFEEVSTW